MFYQTCYIFMIFMIYSFVGWFIEMVAVYIDTKKITNRGFLMGPYCPIYGFGSLILLFFLSKYQADLLTLYLMFVVYASILEYFTSYLMEKLFNARWWDYSTRKFNFNGRICLTNSLAFGALGIFAGYFFNPLIIDILNFISTNVLVVLASIIMVIVITDLCISFNVVTKIRKNITLLNKDMTEDINRQVSKFIEKSHIFKAFPLLQQKINSIKNKN